MLNSDGTLLAHLTFSQMVKCQRVQQQLPSVHLQQHPGLQKVLKGPEQA